MELLENASRDFEDIKDKYCVILIPPPLLSGHALFDTREEAKGYVLEILKAMKVSNPDYHKAAEYIERNDGFLLINKVGDEIERWESRNDYGGDNFQDRQELIDIVIFGDPEEEFEPEDEPNEAIIH